MRVMQLPKQCCSATWVVACSKAVIYELDHFQLVWDVVRVMGAFDEGLLRSLSIDRLPSSEVVGEEARWK